MPSLLAIRHVAYEDLDGLALCFRNLGFDISYLDAWYDEMPRNPLDADVLVVLGAPVGVYEASDYPFIAEELELVRKRIAENRPVLGICFGAQILASALGATVSKGETFEFGWTPLTLTNAGSASPVRHFGTEHRKVFHCHGDSFPLPQGATLLASTEAYSTQAFSYGPHLALQFHGEVTERGLRRWYIGHSARIRSLTGLKTFRASTEYEAPLVNPALPLMVGEWVEKALN